MARKTLAGRLILIAEDEALISMEIEKRSKRLLPADASIVPLAFRWLSLRNAAFG